MDDLRELLTIQEMERRYRPVVTESSLRWQLRNRARNGLEAAGAVTKRTGRWLIHRDLYSAWLLGQSRVA